jgi:long-chain acyl-CoA synthetase
LLLYKWLSEATRTRGSAKALVYKDTYYSWRGLQHRVERRVQEFGAMGIGKGHWVGLMLGNVPDFAILTLALSKMGATVVPLDPTTGTRDLSLILDHAPLRALITRPRGGLDQNAATSPDAPPPPVVPASTKKGADPVEIRRRLQGTLLTCSIYKTPKEPPGKAAAVLFTNDAAGEPKGVLRTEENLEAAAANAAAALEATPDDRILTTVPLFHAYGFDLGLLLALRFGSTLYLEDEVAPARIVKLLREQEIDLLPGTPGLYGGLAKLPTAKPLKIKRARYLSSGSALPEGTADAFRERWGIQIISVYHTTEASMVACDRTGKAPESVGKPIDGIELRIGETPDPKAAAPVGQTAPIWVRGKSCSKGWVGATAKRNGARPAKGGPVAIGETDDKGWLRIGDLGSFDKSGRLHLAGREDHLVKVDGKRVALAEVEGCLEQFPKVHGAKVRVITDPLGGPIMVASVVVAGKCAAEELIDHCAKNLAPYKVPRRIEFCEELPA